jgi:hypothetical protein
MPKNKNKRLKKKNIERKNNKNKKKGITEEPLEKNKRTSFHSEEWNRTQLEITMPKKHSSVVKNTAEGGKRQKPPPPLKEEKATSREMNKLGECVS